MRAQQRRKELLNDYWRSLGIAFVIALCIVPLIGSRRSLDPLVFVPFSSLLFGSAFFLLGTIRSRIRLRSFLLNLMVQTLLMAITIVGCFYVMIWFFISLEQGSRAFGAPILLAVWQIVTEQAWLLVGGLALAGLVNFSFLLGKKLGPGVFMSWMTGKYHAPRMEELVFMFVDMKDSTMWAERLGPVKYSSLIRDFFSDMTLPLLASRGRVSHYIGDEAVLYWKPLDAFRSKGCIAFFKWFEEAVQERRAYYLSQYGLVPEFKGGLHIGSVVATEVGEVKSEIVFHGDTLNTAARIQGMCNDLGAKLLVSQALAKQLALPAGAIMSALGPVRLKGKAAEMELVAIE